MYKAVMSQRRRTAEGTLKLNPVLRDNTELGTGVSPPAATVSLGESYLFMVSPNVSVHCVDCFWERNGVLDFTGLSLQI